MTCAIVIPTRNRKEPLRLTLASLHKEIQGQNIDVCVVDDGSNTWYINEIQDICTTFGARLIRHATCRKMAVARNTGAHATQGEWIVFLDDDILIEPGWYTALLHHLLHHTPDTSVVGIEGYVACSGSGIWDAEVENRSGGSYITCHMIYRRSAFLAAGGFDPAFEHLGPFAEDHELAARMLPQGTILFAENVKVTHQPRHLNLSSYLFSSIRRMQQTLLAEGYFYYRQPAHYHRFRRKRTFWGTYAAICCKYWYTTIKRRTMPALIRHPFQAGVLLFSTLIEQGTAILLFPTLIRRIRHWRLSQLPEINVQETARIWNIPTTTVSRVLTADTFPLASMLFSILKKPAVNYTATLQKMSRSTSLNRPRFIIRIDDCFASRLTSVEKIATLFCERNVPWCMALTANDLHNKEYVDFAKRCSTQTLKSNICYGLHGFTHTGTYGPYASEILQLTNIDLLKHCMSAQQLLAKKGIVAPVFIAPFNGIDYRQINLLSSYFKVITGGPETLRFTGRAGILCALTTGAWYLPSLPPLYGKASEIIRGAHVHKRYPGIHCITLHCDQEAHDNFSATARLLDALTENIAPWEILW